MNIKHFGINLIIKMPGIKDSVQEVNPFEMFYKNFQISI